LTISSMAYDLLVLKIHNPALDMNYIPTCGVLKLSYNGMCITINIFGNAVKCWMKSPEFEGEFTLTKQVEEERPSWTVLIRVALSACIYRSIENAVLQIEYLKAAGEYHVQ